ncbi:hypothetical protein [Streptomyces sp. NPDC002550]
MSDSKSRRREDEDWTPEDMPLGHRTPTDPLPEERLPGEPPPTGAPSRLAGSIGPGRDGLTADDLTPEDTPPHPPGPADVDGGTASGAGIPGERRVPGEGGGAYESPMPDDGLGVPSPGDVTAREARTTESTAPDAWPTAPGGAASGRVGETAPAPSGTGAPLLPHDETDRWEQRMRQLAAGFVDEPRRAVEQADHVVEEIAGRFEEAVERRRRTLRRSWEASEDRGSGSDTDTEQLRLALRDYQELAGRLLHL